MRGKAAKFLRKIAETKEDYKLYKKFWRKASRLDKGKFIALILNSVEIKEG